MKKNWKFYGGLATFIMYLLFMVYMNYWNWTHPNPRLIEFVKTPTNWIDVYMGFVMGAVTVVLAMLAPVVWVYRKGGDDGPGGGRRKINLPIFGKVISIDQLKKMPPKGPVQLAPIDADINETFSEMIRTARRI